MITLKNIHVINEGIKDIAIDGDTIAAVSSNGLTNKNAGNICIDNAIAFPGIINSHDHLHFNLFPQLGNKVYNDYIEWEQDIRHNNKKEIDEVLKIPEQLRVQWSLYKNLLNGVTTVVQHDKSVNETNDLISVFQNCNSLHSIQYEKYWKIKLNLLFKNKWPYAIHVGEGTNKKAREEINTLIKWNLFKKKIIAVHGVAMNVEQAKAFTALIWCPDSNFFLLNMTADIDVLKQHTKILFGTDSTISASWSFWQQLRFARSLSLLTDDELYKSCTTVAADVWGFKNTATIEEGGIADLVIAKRKKETDLESFFSVNPEDILLVIQHGKIKLFDESLLAQLSHLALSNFSKVYVNSVVKYVFGNLTELVKAIRKHNSNINLPIDIE